MSSDDRGLAEDWAASASSSTTAIILVGSQSFTVAKKLSGGIYTDLRPLFSPSCSKWFMWKHLPTSSYACWECAWVCKTAGTVVWISFELIVWSHMFYFLYDHYLRRLEINLHGNVRSSKLCNHVFVFLKREKFWRDAFFGRKYCQPHFYKYITSVVIFCTSSS